MDHVLLVLVVNLAPTSITRHSFSVRNYDLPGSMAASNPEDPAQAFLHTVDRSERNRNGLRILLNPHFRAEIVTASISEAWSDAGVYRLRPLTTLTRSFETPHDARIQSTP